MNTLKAIFFFFARLVTKPFQKVNSYFRNKIRFHGVVRFNSSVKIDSASAFEGSNSIGDRSSFCGSMGYGSYICEDCHIVGTIGRFTSIAAEVRNSQGIHPIEAPFATTSPMFYSLKKQSMTTFARQQLFEEMKAPVEIGNDCWIGCRVFMAGGVRIGDGAVVLSGAVVTKDVPPFSIVSGVPAKVLKYRFDEETIDFLIRTAWWDKSIEWLKDNSELLCDIDRLKQELS